VVLDTPAGRVEAAVRMAGGKPRSVALRSVPSFVQATDATLTVPGLGTVRLDIAYGGNWFAFVHHAQLGLPVELSRLDELMAAARAIRAALAAHGIAGIDPVTGARAPIDHVKIHTDESSAAAIATRALTLCPGRAYDRSPCGTGTSAKLALLYRQGRLRDGEIFRSRSILGTEFCARITGHTTVGDRPAVIPEIEGAAWVTGLQRFVLDPDDPLRAGFAR
jgi:proline racemase